MDVIDEFVKIFDSNSHLLRDNRSFQSIEDWKSLTDTLLTIDTEPQYSFPILIFPPGSLKENLSMISEYAKEKLHTRLHKIFFNNIFGRVIYEITRDSENLRLRIFAIVIENYVEIKKRTTSKGKAVAKAWLNYFYGSGIVDKNRVKFAISYLLEEIFTNAEIIYLDVDTLFFYAEEKVIIDIEKYLKSIQLEFSRRECDFLYLKGKGQYIEFSKNIFCEGIPEYKRN